MQQYQLPLQFVASCMSYLIDEVGTRNSMIDSIRDDVCASVQEELSKLDERSAFLQKNCSIGLHREGFVPAHQDYAFSASASACR